MHIIKRCMVTDTNTKTIARTRFFTLKIIYRWNTLTSVILTNQRWPFSENPARTIVWNAVADTVVPAVLFPKSSRRYARWSCFWNVSSLSWWEEMDIYIYFSRVLTCNELGGCNSKLVLRFLNPNLNPLLHRASYIGLSDLSHSKIIA